MHARGAKVRAMTDTSVRVKIATEQKTNLHTLHWPCAYCAAAHNYFDISNPVNSQLRSVVPVL